MFFYSLINLEFPNLSEHGRTDVIFSVPSYLYKKYFTWGLCWFFFIIHCDICWEYIVRKHQHATYFLLQGSKSPIKENMSIQRKHSPNADCFSWQPFLPFYRDGNLWWNFLSFQHLFFFKIFSSIFLNMLFLLIL